MRAGIVVVVVSFLHSVPAGIVVAIFILVYQQLENHILNPVIMSRTVKLNPLAVLLALAFWTWLWGPMGAFLAVPLTIMSLVTINHLFPADEGKLPG